MEPVKPTMPCQWGGIFSLIMRAGRAAQGAQDGGNEDDRHGAAEEQYHGGRHRDHGDKGWEEIIVHPAVPVDVHGDGSGKDLAEETGREQSRAINGVQGVQKPADQAADDQTGPGQFVAHEHGLGVVGQHPAYEILIGMEVLIFGDWDLTRHLGGREVSQRLTLHPRQEPADLEDEDAADPHAADAADDAGEAVGKEQLVADKNGGRCGKDGAQDGSGEQDLDPAAVEQDDGGGDADVGDEGGGPGISLNAQRAEEDGHNPHAEESRREDPRPDLPETVRDGGHAEAGTFPVQQIGNDGAGQYADAAEQGFVEVGLGGVTEHPKEAPQRAAPHFIKPGVVVEQAVSQVRL